MASEAENWERPPLLMLAKMPSVRDSWNARVAQWESANPELAADWDAALAAERLLAEVRQRDEAHRRALAEAREGANEAGVPLRCLDALDAPKPTAALQAVQAFMGGDATFCLLLGAAGAGKSVAASWPIREHARKLADGDGWVRELGHAYFVRAADVARMSLYGEESDKQLRRLQEATVLALDDMGTERPSDGWLAILDELIDCRYGEKLKTILTTNLDADAFKARYGERISDRIRHDGVVIGAGAESLRTPRKAAK